MNIKLVVTSPFASYQKGDEITVQEEIAAILDTENEHRVVKVVVTE